MRRDMTAAREKVDSEGACRLATSWGALPCDGRLEAAHVVERRYDDEPSVPPVDVIPLCSFHHGRYDARRVSILAELTLEEQAAAVAKLGIIRALKRLTSGSTETVERQ